MAAVSSRCVFRFVLFATLALVLLGMVGDLASAASLGSVTSDFDARDLTIAITNQTAAAATGLTPDADASPRCVLGGTGAPSERGPFDSTIFRDEGRICATDSTNSINVCARTTHYKVPGSYNVYKVVLGLVNYGNADCDVTLYSYRVGKYISGPALVKRGSSCVDVSDRIHGVGWFDDGAYLRAYCT